MKSTLAITAVIFTVGFVSIPVVMSNGDDSWGQYEYRSINVTTKTNPIYQEECGSCHMAYPPGLLPSSSWKIMMSDLEDHFGDNAELDSDTHKSISEYLLNHSRKDGSEDTPLRISKMAYFTHEHDEIPEYMVSGNPKVNSFSHCNACHSKAEKGSFDEDDIRIPGYGRWDD